MLKPDQKRELRPFLFAMEKKILKKQKFTPMKMHHQDCAENRIC